MSDLLKNIASTAKSNSRVPYYDPQFRYNKVNRLIIIGNGFDLAHNLKSSFIDFIHNYYHELLITLSNKLVYDDHFISISVPSDFTEYRNNISQIDGSSAIEYLQYLLSNPSRYKIKWKSDFLKTITLSGAANNWVDIEVEYFNSLKKHVENGVTSRVHNLNKDLVNLREKFIKHLKKQLANTPCTPSHEILEQFDEPIKKSDCQLKTVKKDMPADSTYILNFNYTNIVQQYLKDFNKSEWTHLYIHGQLDGDNVNEQSPVFGFGDELDADYLKFETQSNDSAFEHIKSFKYLQFRTYRRLLEYIEAYPYQVQIFGHSCGVSDRTLLNTIFEHKNCISIKLFYRKLTFGDDYERKTFAISKHFKSKTELRAKVVNRQDSEPMFQPPNPLKNPTVSTPSA